MLIVFFMKTNCILQYKVKSNFIKKLNIGLIFCYQTFCYKQSIKCAKLILIQYFKKCLCKSQVHINFS